MGLRLKGYGFITILCSLSPAWDVIATCPPDPGRLPSHSSSCVAPLARNQPLGSQCGIQSSGFRVQIAGRKVLGGGW